MSSTCADKDRTSCGGEASPECVWDYKSHTPHCTTKEAFCNALEYEVYCARQPAMCTWTGKECAPRESF